MSDMGDDFRALREHSQEKRAANRENSAQMSEWQSIDSAPKDGTRLLLARFGYIADTTGLDEGSPEWKQRIMDNSKRLYCLWWATTGWWSTKWNNWNDGVEPSGLADPTHWMHVPKTPEPPK